MIPTTLLFKIGFLPINLLDVLDILIVGYLMYQIYKLLRGTIAFNILIGVLMLYGLWWLVKELEMDLLFALLDQFVAVGFILLIIIFQPEVRRYLLFLGNNTLRQRSNVLGRLLDRNLSKTETDRDSRIKAVKKALLQMSRRKTGALIVLSKGISLESIINQGIALEANLSQALLESIFNKHSPLHDGAVIIEGGRIKTASSILPVSENPDLPTYAGLRHRAAVGVTERADVAAFVVSEETGRISMANEGRLLQRLDEDQLTELLEQHMT